LWPSENPHHRLVAEVTVALAVADPGDDDAVVAVAAVVVAVVVVAVAAAAAVVVAVSERRQQLTDLWPVMDEARCRRQRDSEKPQR